MLLTMLRKEKKIGKQFSRNGKDERKKREAHSNLVEKRKEMAVL